VNRRAPLPGAAELFRPTGEPGWFDTARPSAHRSATHSSSTHSAAAPSSRRGSGRQKHDTKITVYVSDEELLALEHARLTLRGGHGLAVDRGRVVREAIAVLLADFDENGEESVLVRRLRQDDSQ
jgi:hypothetical protein